jgi:hypothetical protein
MEKISITIDASKLTKSKITARTFTNKEGKEITSQDIKLEVIPVKEPKLIKEGDTWSMWKTHFVAEVQSKEEREQKIKSAIVGDGIIFKNKEADTASSIPF